VIGRIFQALPTQTDTTTVAFIYKMEFGTNTRTTCATLYAFGLDQGEPPIVTTNQ